MSKSEVAYLREQIELDCQASWQALYGLSSGSLQHKVISAHMRHMDGCHQRLRELLGDEQAIEMVSQVYNRVGEAYASSPANRLPSASRQTDDRSTAQATFRKIVLVQEEN